MFIGSAYSIYTFSDIIYPKALLLMVEFVFLFREKERIYKTQIFIKYAIVGCLTASLPCDFVMEKTTCNMESQDVLDTQNTPQ